jgi:pyruvate/2-oxoglutarate dehydrogenase complex dihydrolipoamide acyltransferase (E2) component
MPDELTLPRVGTNMEEATIVRWRKQAGDAFSRGECLYEIETDKVTFEVEAPFDGVLLEARVAETEIAQVGQVVCVVQAAAQQSFEQGS